MVVAVDFDGTIVDNSHPSVGAIKPGVKAALAALRAQGHIIVIWSCRTNLVPYKQSEENHRKCIEDMFNALVDNDIPFDYIDNGMQGKVAADVYVDDRSLRFEGSWKDTYDSIQKISKVGMPTSEWVCPGGKFARTDSGEDGS